MKRVTGIGGVFFKARDPKAMRAWYQTHLGMDVQEWGGMTFRWADDGHEDGVTAWTIFPETSDYFNPSPSSFMVNYRVKDLAGLLDVLRAEGCVVDDRLEESEFGKFGWVMDPEGNRVELWEPPPGSSPG
jgi:catechol 2,3-dioxygenase-like lactoylglutathione lyase family enzyme